MTAGNRAAGLIHYGHDVRILSPYLQTAPSKKPIVGRRWHRLDATGDERQRDRAAHVRFRQPPVVLTDVPVVDLELMDRLGSERERVRPGRRGLEN